MHLPKPTSRQRTAGCVVGDYVAPTLLMRSVRSGKSLTDLTDEHRFFSFYSYTQMRPIRSDDADFSTPLPPLRRGDGNTTPSPVFTGDGEYFKKDA